MALKQIRRRIRLNFSLRALLCDRRMPHASSMLLIEGDGSLWHDLH